MFKGIITTIEPEEFKDLLSQYISQAVKAEIGKICNQEKSSKTIYTRQETAKILEISLPTLHSYTKRNIIKSRHLGKKIRYKIEDIEQALVAINFKK